jgi:DNA-nicking Smr family endonuclease
LTIRRQKRIQKQHFRQKNLFLPQKERTMALNEEEEFQLQWIKNHHMEDKDKEMQKAAEAEAAARPARSPRGRKMRRSPSAWELPVPEDEIDLHGMTSDEAAEAVERRIDDLMIAGLKILRVIHGGGNPSYGNVKRIIDRKVRSEWSNRIQLYKVEPDNAGSSIMILGKPRPAPTKTTRKPAKK